MDADEADGSRRPAKRPRNDATTTSSSSATDRRLYAPFRALGIVTNDVAFAVQSRASKDLTKPAITAVTCTGKSWAMWDLIGPTRLLFVGPPTPSPITSLAVHNEGVYTAAGSSVYKYVRGKQVGELHTIDDLSASTSSNAASNNPALSIQKILIFGSTMCGLSVDGKRLFVWDLAALELSATIDFDDSFTANCVLHPATYLNKVLVASKEGTLQLWNISTRQLIHTFDASALSSNQNIFTTAVPITCLVQSPAVDVVAIGYQDGRIVLFDIRLGELLLQFTMAVDAVASLATPTEVHAIAALSFRTDSVAQSLAAADAAGNMAIWDLNAGGSLVSVVRRAHIGRIGSIEFLPGQAVLVSSGADNALRQWAFDTPTSPPRLLRERSGHHSPPSIIRYYGNDGKALLSASRGDRTLRYTSIVRDSRSFELSQGSVSAKANKLDMKVDALKLPPIESIAFAGQGTGAGGVGTGSLITREWDDVITCHGAEHTAFTWSVQNKRLGKLRLRDPSMVDTGAANAACVTACGNFGLVGYENARVIVMWNLQSGIRRRTFRLPGGKNADRRLRKIVGLATDALNTLLVAATIAGDVHYYDFHKSTLLESTRLPAGITSISLQRDNNLMACVCDDFTVRMIDIETRRIVREFSGYRGRIIDLAFSHDSKWLVVASSDSIVRTFDIPTGQLIDAFRTSSLATSLCFSPTGDFLATSHVDSIGVFLWANRAQFADVSLRSVNEAELLSQAAAILPGLQLDVDDDDAADATDLPSELEDAVAAPHALTNGHSSDDFLEDGLATLSLMPRSKWQTLINLETINSRNKPKEPPKAPEQAPFFLPTLPGTAPRFDTSVTAALSAMPSQAKSTSRTQSTSHRLGLEQLFVESDLVKMLRSSAQVGDYDDFFSRLFSLTPANLDLELRSLDSPDHLALFIRALENHIARRMDFEAVQAVLNAFLSVQSEALAMASKSSTDALDSSDMSSEHDESLDSALRSLLTTHERESRNISSLVRNSLGLVAWTRGVPVV